jgi:hypothetical protein
VGGQRSVEWVWGRILFEMMKNDEKDIFIPINI